MSRLSFNFEGYNWSSHETYMVYSVVCDNQEEFKRLLSESSGDYYESFYKFVLSKVNSDSLVSVLMDTIAYDCDFKEAFSVALSLGHRVVDSEARQDSPF